VERNLTALVIGNSTYQHVEALKNPTNDAEDVSNKLSSLGFSVTTLTNATTQQMEEGLLQFGEALKTSSVGLVFFAGHAFQIDGKNYLAGVDTRTTVEASIKHSALDLDYVLDIMKGAAAPTGFVILDACRNNPFAGRPRSVASNELATVYAPKGTLVAFSTSPGQTSLDGADRNGPYTEALLQHIATPNLLVETMFKRVRSTLESSTNGRQTSWEHTSLTGDFRFRPSVRPVLHGYGQSAIADGLAPRSLTSVGVAIDGLKTYNWYKQNDALDALSMEQIQSSSTDEAFILGRNIYQAACGGANSARAFLADFTDKTAALAEPHRKAILDGMLYEVFFDSEGQHREHPKLESFDNLFKLQAHAEYGSSFSFIQGCLAPFADRYFEIPGSGQEVTLSVITAEGEEDARVISDIWWDSVNILHKDLVDDSQSGWFALRDQKYKYGELVEYLSKEIVLPLQQLRVDLDFPYMSGTYIIWPAGFEVQKPSPLASSQ
jgi:Caspase domain